MLGQEGDPASDLLEGPPIRDDYRDPTDADVAVAAFLVEREAELDVRIPADLSGLGASRVGGDPELLVEIEKRDGADARLIGFGGREIDALRAFS